MMLLLLQSFIVLPETLKELTVLNKAIRFHGIFSPFSLSNSNLLLKLRFNLDALATLWCCYSAMRYISLYSTDQGRALHLLNLHSSWLDRSIRTEYKHIPSINMRKHYFIKL